MYTNQIKEHVYIGIISPLQCFKMCWRFMGQKAQMDLQYGTGFRGMLGQYQFGATWYTLLFLCLELEYHTNINCTCVTNFRN